MPEEKPQKISTIIPDQGTFEEAKRDLLSDLDDSMGGQHPEGRFRPSQMEDGVYVVNYSFAQSEFASAYSREGEKFVPLSTPEEKSRIRAALDEIEKVANIKFLEAAPGCESHIRYFKGQFKDDTYAGRENTGTIFLSEKKGMGKGTILHETLHALGISHPGANGQGDKAGGNNPHYTTDTTVMSYNPGMVTQEGLGPFDIAVLQAIYGKPPAEETSATVRMNDLLDARFLFAQKPLTLDISNIPSKGKITKGNIMANMDEKISAVLFTDTECGVEIANVLLTEGTRIQNLITHPDTEISLEITGNALPNRIQSGKWDDKLMPRGGGDVLTGGAAQDKFIIDDKAGFRNIITDLEPADMIVLRPAIARAELCYRPEFRWDGNTCSGTEIVVKDKDANPIASVFVANQKPDKVLNQIRTEGFGPIPINTREDSLVAALEQRDKVPPPTPHALPDKDKSKTPN